MKLIKLYMVLISTTFLYGCEDLTYEEFKSKYDWAETECIVTSIPSHLIVDFVFNGKKYRATNTSCNLHLVLGEKYLILFDKNAPEKHFIIQFDKPIKPNVDQVIKTTGYITGVYKATNFCYVEFKTLTPIKTRLFGQSEYIDQNWVKWEEYLPMSYYENARLLKVRKIEIEIDLFPLNTNEFGHLECRQYINLDQFKNIML